MVVVGLCFLLNVVVVVVVEQYKAVQKDDRRCKFELPPGTGGDVFEALGEVEAAMRLLQGQALGLVCEGLLVYVCVYIYIYIYTHTHHIYIYIHMCVCMCLYVCMNE